MRNFVITVNGKSYEVGVEEVGATASAPVAAAPKAAVSAPQAAPGTRCGGAQSNSCKRRKSRFSFPRTH